MPRPLDETPERMSNSGHEPDRESHEDDDGDAHGEHLAIGVGGLPDVVAMIDVPERSETGVIVVMAVVFAPIVMGAALFPTVISR
jgi:hypothetical protein